jgi:hypothetical protein
MPLDKSLETFTNNHLILTVMKDIFDSNVTKKQRLFERNTNRFVFLIQECSLKHTQSREIGL